MQGGIWKSFEEIYQLGLIDSVPKLIAVEPFDRIGNALSNISNQNYIGNFNNKAIRNTPSIAGKTVTPQTLQAIK